MEGVSHEAASFAGHQRLDNLCWIYDNNHISIDGHTEITYDDDVAERFEGYGWNVTRVADANDFNEITRAFDAFKATEDRPTLIIVDSHIGYGSPHKQDTAAAHGEPLGEEEVRETKRFYGWPEDAQFLVPDGVRERFADGVGARGAAAARGVGAAAGQLRARAPVARAPDRRDAAARAARRLGPRHPHRSTPTRRGSRPARPRTRSRTRSPRTCPGCSSGSADLTDSTSVRLDEKVSGGDFQPDDRGGPPAPLRDPRARVGGDLERALAVEAAPVVVDLPDLLRLRAAGDPALGADGAAGDPHLHPRLDRPRRGRPDPPAGRAARLAARDPRPERDPALRRERGRRGLAGGDRPHPRPGRAGADAPERAGPRPLDVRVRPRGCAAAATCSPTPATATRS